MQFPVARAVMNDGSWCFKALLHLAVHLVSPARFSLGPSVFFLWLTGSKNSNRSGYWLTVGEMTVSWCFLQAFASHIPTGHRCFNTADHCFILHSFCYIYNICVLVDVCVFVCVCVHCVCGFLTLFACKSDLSHLVLIWCSELALWQLQYKQEHLRRSACFQAS